MFPYIFQWFIIIIIIKREELFISKIDININIMDMKRHIFLKFNLI
jgi:hypothetical protein